MKRFTYIQFAARSDVGKKRKNNEDALGAFPSAGIFCVADGMGGGDDGEIASAAVVKAVEDVSKRCIPPDDGAFAAADVADVLENGLCKASEWIFNRANDKRLSGCGSTFVGVVLDATHPDSALAVHAGDSRLYLLHGRSIKQITRDHSAAEMIGAKDESKLNPMFRSMVMNAIGIRTKVDPERTPFKIAEGDRILICSDGLSRMVPDKKILSISRKHADVGEAVDALILAALEAGGVDNVTVLLAEVGPLPEPAKVLTLPEASADFVDDDADTGSTDGTDAETEGSTQTVQTVQPFVMRTRLDLSKDLPKANVSDQGSARRRWMMIGTIAGILILAGVVAIVLMSRRGDGKTTATGTVEVPVTNAAKTAALHSEALHGEVIHGTNVVEAEEVPVTNAAKMAALHSEALHGEIIHGTNLGEVVEKPVTNAAKMAALNSEVPHSESINGEVFHGTNLVEAVEKPVTNSLEKPVIPAGDVKAVCTNLVAACESARIGTFMATLRRLFPDGKIPYDCSEQANVFGKNAKECQRMHSRKSVEAVAVDLQIVLTKAESARNALQAMKPTEHERRWLADWDKIVSGDPNDIGVQEACARLIVDAAEVQAR